MKRSITEVALELACEQLYDVTDECAMSYIDAPEKCENCDAESDKAISCLVKYFKDEAKMME